MALTALAIRGPFRKNPGRCACPRLPEIGRLPQGDPPETFYLEEHVGFLLRKAYQRHSSLFLEAATEHALTPMQFAALNKIAEMGRVTQNHLGRMVARVADTRCMRAHACGRGMVSDNAKAWRNRDIASRGARQPMIRASAACCARSMR